MVGGTREDVGEPVVHIGVLEPYGLGERREAAALPVGWWTCQPVAKAALSSCGSNRPDVATIVFATPFNSPKPP